MRWFAAALLTALLMLQYRLWLSDDGVREMLRLRSAVAVQQGENARLEQRNREFEAEVRDLKQGYTALEERARTDLGMIAGNETFYQVVPQQSAPPAAAPLAAPTTPAQRTAAAR
jgi:cell division protein FtsB